MKPVDRSEILDDKKRSDGRDFADIRDIDVETSVLPRTHGSVVVDGERRDVQITLQALSR